MTIRGYRPPKAFFESVTVWLNIIMGVVFAFLALAQTPEFGALLDFLPPAWKNGVAATIGFLTAIANIYVRVKRTNTAIVPSKGISLTGLLAVIAISTLLFTGCGTAAAAVDHYQFPALKQVATPAQAEEVLYAGTLGYQFVVGAINALHDAKLFPDAKHESLIAAPNSPAEKVRVGLSTGFVLAQRWREDGSRGAFDALYVALTANYDKLSLALRTQGRR